MNIKIISIIFLSSFMVVSACAAVKETNPNSPQFDESQFQFEDYAHFEKFRYAMEAMFPVGTSKERIDRTLVEIGGATMFDDGMKVKIARRVDENERVVRYYKNGKPSAIQCSFTVAAVFNNANVLTKKIDGYYGCTGP